MVAVTFQALRLNFCFILLREGVRECLRSENVEKAMKGEIRQS